MVGQDLPQHLTYARILADYGDPRLPFRDTYTLPAAPQPYFTAYIVLAWLTRLTSVLTACRVVYSAYVIAMATGFTALVRTLHAPVGGDDRQADSRIPWTCMFGALLNWNPVQCVGFLPFMLGLPAILFGAAFLLRLASRPSLRSYAGLALAAGAATSLHFVSAGCLAAFSVFYAVFRPSRRSLRAALTALAATFCAVLLWRFIGERGLDPVPVTELVENVKRSGLHAALAQTLGVQWSDWNVKLGFMVATVCGPLPQVTKAVIAGGMLTTAAVVWTARRKIVSSPSPWRPRLAYGLAVVAFLAMTAATPAAIRVPDDICLLDFRMYVVAFLLAIPLIPPRWLEPRRAHIAATAFCVMATAIWGRALGGTASEARAVLRLVDRLGPTETVLALPFHDRSEFLDENNSVTHYFPVYFTALRGGTTSLFWGKFSHHLPVGFRPGHEPQRPPDWDPSKFTRAELTSTSHVLVEWPDPDDGDVPVTGASRLQEELGSGFTPLACEGRWCLYRSPSPEPRDVTAMAEAR
jgi:hypothetical protein